MSGLTENDLLSIELRARKVTDPWAIQTIATLLGEVRNLGAEILELQEERPPPRPRTTNDPPPSPRRSGGFSLRALGHILGRKRAERARIWPTYVWRDLQNLHRFLRKSA